MKTDYISSPALLERAVVALIEKLGIAKASQFWTSLGYGSKDYTRLRKKLFQGKDVEGLYKEIKKNERR